MGYVEDQQAIAARERQSVRMGNADPNNLYSISGNAAYKASNPTSSVSSWTADTSFPAYPTSLDPGPQAYDYPASDPRASFPVVRRPPAPRQPDWTDRAMQRIPQPLLVACAVVGGLIGLGMGASSGALAAIFFALMGAGAGLLALPALIKLVQLALRVLAVGAVLFVLGLILWAVAHSGK